MPRIRVSIAVIAVFFLEACAVHPLPEDFEGFNTVQIVQRIRCEARRAVQDEAIDRLKRVGDPLAEILDRDRDKFRTFDQKELSRPEERYFYNRYIKSAISYDYTFDISEDNMDNAEVDLLKAISGGKLSLALKAGSDRGRDAARGLVVTDTFEQLLKEPYVCDAPPYQDKFDVSNHGVPNLVYPITGSIGLYEVVKSFIELNEAGLLNDKAPDKAPVLTDTLMFTTTLTGSANPQVSLTQVGHNVDLSLASLTSSVSRKDMNKVILALSLKPKKGYEHALFLGPFAAGASGARIFATRTGNDAVERSLDAISQQRINTFYDRFSQFVR